MYNEYKNILVPVDGSKYAEAAVAKAAEVAIRNEGRLDILSVINTTSFGFTYGVLSDDAITRIVDGELDYLKDLVKKISTKTGFENIHMHVRFGNPKNVITYDFPKDYHTDLIMMGATGKSAAERLLVGSTASYVNSHAKYDVMIVRTSLKNQPITK